MSAIDFEGDAEHGSSAQGDTLARISQLASLMTEQKRAVDAAEEALVVAKQALLRTETEDLPELMREIGLDEVKLVDGSKVSVKDDLTCGLSEERRPAGLAWLEEHGFGGLIKTAVSLEFVRGEGELAAEVAQRIAEEFQREVTMKRDVHAATLKSFLKEELAKGADSPLDSDAQALFAVRPFPRAKLTPPKVVAPRARK